MYDSIGVLTKTLILLFCIYCHVYIIVEFCLATIRSTAFFVR